MAFDYLQSKGHTQISFDQSIPSDLSEKTRSYSYNLTVALLFIEVYIEFRQMFIIQQNISRILVKMSESTGISIIEIAQLTILTMT